MIKKIIIKDLKKSFFQNKKENLVLKIQELTIDKNEFVSLVGLSGCGKTTLLNILAGFLPYDCGEVNIFGKTDLKPGSDRACVFQEDAVFPWMTVKNNIDYGLKIRGVDKEKRTGILKHYLELVGLKGTENYYPKELSGGMKKRVDLARAMANSPETILMDEPFGALDYRTRKDLQLGFQKFLSIDAKTVVFVTHDIGEAIFLSDRVIVLSKSPGSIILDTKVPFSKPRSKDVCDSKEFIDLRNKIEMIISQNEL